MISKTLRKLRLILESNKIPVPKSEPLLSLKIGIVGDQQIGKSAFVRCLQGEQFDARYEPTLLIDFQRALSIHKKKPISVS